MNNAIDHDRLFKELLTTFFGEFIELFFPAVYAYMDADTITFLDKELFTDVTEGDTHEVDIVAKARFRDQEAFFLVHVENQAKKQPEFGKRMFDYFYGLFSRHDLPVYPIALFSYDKPLLAEPDGFSVAFPDLTPLDFRYRVIQLNRLNWRDFVRQHNPVASALMAKMRIAPEDRPKVKLECLRLLATLKLNPAKMRLISGFVDTYLRLNAEEKQQFQQEIEMVLPFEQKEEVMEIVTSWMEEGIKKGHEQGLEEGMQIATSWMEEGIEKGIEQGLKQGREEGIERTILRQLRKRFGAISEPMEARIYALNEAQLDALAEALLDFRDVTEAEAWLAAQL